jgi:hypothetical protein
MIDDRPRLAAATHMASSCESYPGVSTELHVYPSADHASEIFEPSPDLSRQIWSTRFAALERVVA